MTGFKFRGSPRLDEGEPSGFGFGGRVESEQLDPRGPAELREVSERREESPNDRPIPEPRLKARKIRFEFFEALTFKSVAVVIGAVGDDSLEGQIERWRVAKIVNGAVTLPDGTTDPLLRTAAGEKEFHDYEYRFDGTTHYLFIRYTE